MQKEVWRDIPNFQGDYQVSDLGNVKSLKFSKERILKPSVHKDGYLFVTLHGNNLRKVKLIHHLVAESFLNHVPNGFKMVIDHINDIPNDNRLSNLQIVTHRYNICKTQGKYASRFKGVYRSGKKWKSQIVVNNELLYLGTFTCEITAHLVYSQKLATL